MIGARDPICWRPISSGTWLHVAAVYENGEHRLYLDGEFHDSIQHGFWTHARQPIHIGRKGTHEPQFFFRGDIDDVRLYNRALHDDDIRALFEVGGWRPPVRTTDAGDGDPLSGHWGRKGVVVLDLLYDGVRAVSGRIMARDPEQMSPITRGSFDRATGALQLEGTATHPDDHSPVPFLIKGRLLAGEITVARNGPRMLCLISDQHRDVANLVIGIGVAVGFGDLVEPVSSPDHGAQLAGVDQLL
jgi:concanavalin A-like lectin/glucanase superfamily protein